MVYDEFSVMMVVWLCALCEFGHLGQQLHLKQAKIFLIVYIY